MLRLLPDLFEFCQSMLTYVNLKGGEWKKFGDVG